MAKQILRNAYFSVNAVDLSSYVESIEIDVQRKMEETTSMGATGVGKIPGLKDESITVNWRQDFAAAKVDATCWPLYDAGTAFAIEIRPDAGAVSATNPKWTSSTAYIESYGPVAGSVGSTLDAPMTIQIDGVLVRAVA